MSVIIVTAFTALVPDSHFKLQDGVLDNNSQGIVWRWRRKLLIAENIYEVEEFDKDRCVIYTVYNKILVKNSLEEIHTMLENAEPSVVEFTPEEAEEDIDDEDEEDDDV